MKKIFIALICFMSFILVSCNNEEIDYSLNMNYDFPISDTLENGNNQNAKVIILLGQSNASGCSIVEYLFKNTSEAKFQAFNQGFKNILINYCIDDHYRTSQGEFKPVDLTCGCGDGFFGPEVGIAETLSTQFPNEQIFILKYTMSGYSLNHHWLNYQKRGDIYNACITFLRTYLDYLISKNYNINVDCICWMQGESDTTEEKAAKYLDNQKALVSYFREDLKKYSNNEIYFIDAGISSSPYCLPGYPQINQAKADFSDLSPYNLYFSTIENNLTTLYEPDYEPDLGHYDALSEIKLGQLFGEYIIKTYNMF